MRSRMRLLCRLLALSLAPAVTAQEPVKPALTPRIITATRQVSIFSDLERQLLLAVQKKDEKALDALLADDCSIEMPDADSLSGEDWTASVLDKSFALKSFQVRQVSAIEQGDVVVVKFDRVQQATLEGKDASGEFFVVDLWKKAGGSWKLSNRYVAKVGPVPPPAKTVPRPTGKQ
jgi:ketosteroid isomerase-like protein